VISRDLTKAEELEVATLAGAMYPDQPAGVLSATAGVVDGALLVSITTGQGGEAGVFLNLAMLDAHVAHCQVLRDRL
jgi:hypothetical protein